jgi:hypothetical protein
MPSHGWRSVVLVLRMTAASRERSHGSPPVSSAEQIASSPSPQRQAADRVLAAGYGIAARPAIARRSDRGRVRLPAGTAQGGPVLALAPRGALLRSLANIPFAIGVSRFGPGRRPAYFASLPCNDIARVQIPMAPANVRWRLSVTTARRAARVAVVACPFVS